MSAGISAAQFVARLQAHRSPEELEKYRRYFKVGEGDEFIGVRMGQVFALAKEFIELPPGEIEKLLDSPIHEVRAGGLSIMDKQARRGKTPASRRKELFDLYLRRTDRINNWDLVDVGAPYVVGGYLFDKPRDVLYELARSETSGNAAPRFSVPDTSSGKAMWPTPSRSPSCCSPTTMT
jgi:hypothetical protein